MNGQKVFCCRIQTRCTQKTAKIPIFPLHDILCKVQGVITGTYVSTRSINSVSCTHRLVCVTSLTRDSVIYRYARVKTACELDHDIAHLPAADDTEVCEHGINLSGGQKARIALARAVYSQPDIILMDDSLSAVDPTTAKSVFDQCIGPDGLLRCDSYT